MTGDTEKDAQLSRLTQDTVNDDGESVKLGFGSSLPTGVTAGLHGRDDGVDHGRRRAVGNGHLRSRSSYTVGEGNTVTVTVILSTPTPSEP